MAGFPDLQNPQVQQGLRDTFSDPSYGRAFAQAMPQVNPADLGAAWGQMIPSGSISALRNAFGGAKGGGDKGQFRPFLQGFMGGLQDTQPQLRQWLQSYKPFQPRGDVSAWV